MDNLFLAIVTGDRDYGRSLSLGMLSVCRNFIIRIFSAEEFLQEKREYDLILWDGLEAKEAYGGRIVYLAEKPSETAVSRSQKRFCIYKYSPAACMTASVFEIYKELTGRRAVNVRRQDVRLFAFTSCEGGAGCTTVAMAAAQEFSRFRDKKVMYLSFEELESVGRFMKHDAGIRGAEVYLYRLFNKMYSEREQSLNAEENTPFIEGHIVRDDYGIEAFAPSCGRNPLREVGPDEVCRLMSAIINSGRYDVIIMDIGSWLSKTSLKCLEMAEKICMVTKKEGSRSRESKYLSHIVSCCGEEVTMKIIRAENRRNEKNDAETAAGKNGRIAENAVNISECDSFTRGEGYTTTLLEGKFGSNINILAEKLAEPLKPA